MAIRMQQRRGTAAQWISLNDGDGPILGAGEIGFESDTGKFKIGDGTNHWIDLDYFLDSSELNTSLDGYIPTSLLGANDGVAQLNASGKLVSTQIPNVDEITQDAINSALIGGDGITKTYDDAGNTITIDVDITASGGLKIDTGKLTVDPLVTQLRVANVTDTEIGYLDGVTSSIQTQLNNKLASADLTEAAQDAVNTAIVAGTGLDKTYDDAGNTITLDIDSTVATLTGTQTLTNKTLTSPIVNTPTGITKSDVGLANVDNTSDANKPVSTAAQTALDLKAPKADPTFTGTVSGVTKSHVGLGNVDNTSDANKPVSTATQTALDAKLASATAATTYAPIASPTFTGTVTLPTGTVTSGMILDGTILNEDINASAAIALSKLATDPLARANHTGSQTASTISDFNEAAQDAVGGTLGSGLTYTDASNTITVDSTVVQLRVTNVTDTEIGYLDGVTSAIQTQMDAKAPLASPTFTGTVSAAALTLSGDLTVNGTTTTINSTTLAVNDKNIVLGDVATPTDVTADGGGITLKGTTDKTFNWVDATDAWTSSEDMNLLTGKVYEINGTTVLSGSTLGSGVTGSSLTSVGTLTTGTWSATTIALNKGGTGATTQAGAANAVLPAQTSNSGKYLTTDGTNVSWGTVAGYSAPTLGSTSIASGATVTTIAGLTLTSPVISSISNTGTITVPTTTGTLALLSQVINNTLLTTTGDLVYASSANTPARLAAGTSGYVLTAQGAGVAPVWAAAAGGGGADEVKLVMGAY